MNTCELIGFVGLSVLAGMIVCIAWQVVRDAGRSSS